MGSYTGPRSAVAFLRYARAVADREFKEHAFRLYVTESLRLQGEGKYITSSLDSLINRRVYEFDADSVIEQVASKLEQE